MKKVFLFIFTGLLILTPLFSQSYPRGTVLDEALYNSLPRKARLLTRGYESLPRSVSLKQYAPYPGDQGEYGTCTAWASGYAARTIAESVALNRQDRALTSGNVFSPVFVYKSISTDINCARGTAIAHALNVMKTPGIPRRGSAERTSDFRLFPISNYQNSVKFPIAGYAILYSNWQDEAGNDTANIQAVKKALSEKKPVIIGMNTPLSFNTAKSPWQPWESHVTNWGGHALCVVGYDDTLYGGAFEIQNSWGEEWGNDGYIWIRYNNFTKFVREAYELIEDLTTYKDATLYSGFVDIELFGSDKGMPVIFDESGYYRTSVSYPSGTRFRFIMGNNHPAYVYAFTADSSTKKTNLIFPLEELNESPVLDYSENKVAWPGEYDWMQMDNVTGTDYLIVLYSKQELKINEIRERFTNASGSFPERAARAVGSDYVPHSNIRYERSKMAFSGGMMNKQAVMALLLAIDHR